MTYYEIKIQLHKLVDKWAFQLHELSTKDKWNTSIWNDRDLFWDDIHEIDFNLTTEISPITVTSCLGTMVKFTFSQYKISEFDFPQNSKHK